MMVFVLLLNRLHVFVNLIFNLDSERDKKTLDLFVHIMHWDQGNRARNADQGVRTRERFVYSIVKIRLYDYQTWQTHFWGEKSTRSKVALQRCL